ncbi:WD40-repeat-containing domain protein [Zopfochytrium polystomum]|nr:WD40-repeat-containing domain protein [Zopfochytrium polystomum]
METSDPSNFFQSDQDLAALQQHIERKARIDAALAAAAAAASATSAASDSTTAVLDASAAAAALSSVGAVPEFVHSFPSKILAIAFVAPAPFPADAGPKPLWAFLAESGHVARRIDLKTGKASNVYKGHGGPVTSLAVSYSSADGSDEFLYTGSWDKSIRKWDVKSHTCLQIYLAHADFVKSLLLFSPTRLCSGSSDRTIYVWDTTPQPPADLDSSSTAKTATTSSTATPATTRRPLVTINGDHTRGIEALARVGDVLFSASSDTSIRAWDIATGRPASAAAVSATAAAPLLKGHLTSVYGLVTVETDDGDTELWSASADKTAKRWNLEGIPDASFTHPDFVKCLAVVAGQYLVCGGRDENIWVWDIATEKTVKVIEAHFGEISCLGLHGGLLWTGSLDGTVRGWKIRGTVLPALPRFFPSLH